MREQVDYDGVIVMGDLDLSGLDLLTRHVERTGDEIGEGLTEDLKLVVSLISIKDSEIRGEVNLSNAKFQNGVSFSKTNFTKNADFGEAKFGGDAYFGEAKFGGDAYFGEAKFGGDANFGYARFSGGASFLGTKFSGGDADFEGAVFSGGDADFWGAEFSGGDAYFGDAQFSGGDAYFGEAVFSGGDANFGYARFSGGDADFGYARFSGGDAYFEGAEFSGDKADFGETKFSGGDANFIMATFGGTVDFKRAKFSKSFIIEWRDIKDSHEYDPILYSTLIKNYKDLSWFEDVDDCYYRYRKKRRTGKPPRAKISDIVAQVGHGYWVKPMYPIKWSIFFILFFGLFFLYIGDDGITKYSTQGIYENSNMSSTTVKIDLIESHVLLLDYFLFSMETFTSGLTSFLAPRCFMWVD